MFGGLFPFPAQSAHTGLQGISGGNEGKGDEGFAGGDVPIGEGEGWDVDGLDLPELGYPPTRTHVQTHTQWWLYMLRLACAAHRTVQVGSHLAWHAARCFAHMVRMRACIQTCDVRVCIPLR
jgi:hypothetical protein